RRAEEHEQTIVVVTHTLNTIDACHEVAFIENSKDRAIGLPSDLLSRLEQCSSISEPVIPDFYRWADVFEHFQTVEERREGLTSPTSEELQEPNEPSRRPPPTPFRRQVSLLLRRYAQMRRNDSKVLLLTAALGLI